MARRFAALMLLLPLALGGCANFKDEGWQPRRALGADLETFRPPREPLSATPPAALVEEPTGAQIGRAHV